MNGGSGMQVRIDRGSLLADVDGAMSLAACEAALQKEGLTLDVVLGEQAQLSIGEWLARGGPGARDPWLDPADHLVAGLEATLKDGRTLSIKATPRRAVGPDLIALVVGMGGRYAKVTRASLRVHPVGIERPRTHPVVVDREPPVSEGEARLMATIAGELGGE